MAKDRAAPFSRKHRRYWIPVTGGMLLIGLLNIAIGLCSYDEPKGPPQPIELHIPVRDAAVRPPGSIDYAQIPGAVMRTFASHFPRTVPAGARRLETDGGVVYELGFPPGREHHHATIDEAGALLGTD